MQPRQRLQKILAANGFGSRRQIEGWIKLGRIQINNKLAQLGDRIGADDVIKLNDKVVQLDWPDQHDTEGLILHKPEGLICSRKDERDRPTVFDNLPNPKFGRWINVGRLDFNSQGLLIFVNNGELADNLMHPRNEIIREYQVRVLGKLSEEQVGMLRKGVMLEDGMARFEMLQALDQGREGVNHWYKVRLREGRNREVRRMFEAVEIPVNRLIRTRFGPLFLPRNLSRGRYVQLTTNQVELLGQAVLSGSAADKLSAH